MDKDPNAKTKSFWNITIESASQILNIEIEDIRAVPVQTMLAESRRTSEGPSVDDKTMDKLKEVVYSNILQFLSIEGYPSESTSDFKEANVSDLVLYIIGPIIHAVQKTGRRLRLKREKVIISAAGPTSGREEFVVMDRVAIGFQKFVLIIEGKRGSIGRAMAQIFLAMKTARDHNEGGILYGFVTTGEDWRMVSYDGSEFVETDKFLVLFDTMEDGKEKWRKEYSILVDCMVAALMNGGKEKENMVARGLS